MKKILSSNLVERLLWTLAQAALGLLTVEALHVPVAYSPLIAAGLSAAKTYVKGQLDARASAAS